MRIGIIAPAGSPLAKRLQEKLILLTGSAADLFDADLPEGTRVSLGEGGASWDGISLDGFDGLFIHGFRYEDPVLPVADPAADWSLWQAGHVRQQQRYSLFYSLLARLEAGHQRLYNGPSVHLEGFSRLHQLERLGLTGARVAAAIVTNDPAEAERFCSAHTAAGAPVVWRTATGRCAWQIFRDRQRRHLIAADKPPVMLAPVVPGLLRRAFVIDGQVVLTVQWAAPSLESLERFEQFHVVEAARDGNGIEGRSLSALGIRWGSALYVAGPEGPVIYDVDVDPLIADLPAPLRDHLASCLAAGLAGGQPPAYEGPAVIERDSLFLRRMLRIQFEMEQTKLAEPAA
ncbi:hypothetical protein SAE02_00170 [Skermanella aerolata]|uniref:Uncharacterized protein n=1 Tax=Skermanella aerolata TaxID=393310 RepID=A0A512DHB4_9PROT|nr:hypothetical protein [Skermanella aerolata]KJB94112.1 hypothetical protein N826_20355 [Skermanella aerolata KACC 11604]GEO35869.1 hypothetical protein SAE02_00170 [Skermanella aerolata]